MEETIFDGECHALNDDLGYIAKRITEISEDKLSEFIDEQLIKYADYLYQNDKQKVIEYLVRVFKSQLFYQSKEATHQVVYRPPWLNGYLDHFSTLILKFKRAEKDKLEEAHVEGRKFCCK